MSTALRWPVGRQNPPGHSVELVAALIYSNHITKSLQPMTSLFFEDSSRSKFPIFKSNAKTIYILNPSPSISQSTHCIEGIFHNRHKLNHTKKKVWKESLIIPTQTLPNHTLGSYYSFFVNNNLINELVLKGAREMWTEGAGGPEFKTNPSPLLMFFKAWISTRRIKWNLVVQKGLFIDIWLNRRS